MPTMNQFDDEKLDAYQDDIDFVSLASGDLGHSLATRVDSFGTV